MKIGKEVKTFEYLQQLEGIRRQSQDQLFDNLYCLSFNHIWEYEDNKRKPLQREIEIWT